ncbi:MAG: hypothetical protein ACOH2B_09285 [Burkholderiaceae bacterium]
MKTKFLRVFAAGALLTCVGFATASESFQPKANSVFDYLGRAQTSENMQMTVLQSAVAESETGPIALTEIQMDDIAAGGSFAFASAQSLYGIAFAKTRTTSFTNQRFTINTAISIAIAIGPGAQATAISFAR